MLEEGSAISGLGRSLVSPGSLSLGIEEAMQQILVRGILSEAPLQQVCETPPLDGTGHLHDTCVRKVVDESVYEQDRRHEYPSISLGRVCPKGPQMTGNMPMPIANRAMECGSGLLKFCRGIC